jgi:hypothetical protein
MSTSNETDTFGWDTIFAIPIKDANQAIVNKKSSPSDFKFENTADKIYCQGDFGDWQICMGGSGSLVRLKLPISNISGYFYSGTTKVEYSCKGTINAIIQVKLKYLPHKESSGDSKDGTFHELVVRKESGNPQDPVVSVISVDWQGNTITPGIAKYAVEGAIGGWCNGNIGEFAHVFATVNLNKVIDKDAWAFCNPSYVSYSYLDKTSTDDSLLAVLCMTGGRTTKNNIQQISPFTIPNNSESGFLISRRRFLVDLILPTFPLQWSHASTDDFEVTTDNRYIKLKEGKSVQLPDVEHNGTSYTPYLKTFSIQIQNEHLIINSYTETQVFPGITAWCQSTKTYTISLGQSSKGQTLVYNEVGSGSEEHGTHTSPGVEIAEWMIGIIAVIALVILGILTDGAAFFIGALIIGMLAGLAAATPTIVELVNTDDSPSVDLLAFNISNPIKWADSKDYQLQSAGLNGPLQLGGNLSFG